MPDATATWRATSEYCVCMCVYVCRYVYACAYSSTLKRREEQCRMAAATGQRAYMMSLGKDWACLHTYLYVCVHTYLSMRTHTYLSTAISCFRDMRRHVHDQRLDLGFVESTCRDTHALLDINSSRLRMYLGMHMSSALICAYVFYEYEYTQNASLTWFFRAAVQPSARPRVERRASVRELICQVRHPLLLQNTSKSCENMLKS
jgi:hypothetical protein